MAYASISLGFDEAPKVTLTVLEGTGSIYAHVDLGHVTLALGYNEHAAQHARIFAAALTEAAAQIEQKLAERPQPAPAAEGPEVQF